MKRNTYKELITAFILSTLMMCTLNLHARNVENKKLIHDTRVDTERYIKELVNGINELEFSNTILKENINELNLELENVKKEHEKLKEKTKVIEKKAVSRSMTSRNKSFTVEATAYTHTGNPTASGVMPKVGRTIAVDPKVIPLGSKVYIEGMGTYIAEDTGGVIKGNIIDIFMNTEAECKNWGRRKVRIEVL